MLSTLCAYHMHAMVCVPLIHTSMFSSKELGGSRVGIQEPDFCVLDFRLSSSSLVRSESAVHKTSRAVSQPLNLIVHRG